MNKKCEDCGYELNSIDDECDNIDCVKCVVNVMKEQDVRGLTEVELMCMGEAMTATGKFVDDGTPVGDLVRDIEEYLDGYEESVGPKVGGLIRLLARSIDHIEELEATIQRVRDGAAQYGENLIYEVNRLLEPQDMGKCNPEATEHGFDKDASHTADGYVCICETNQEEVIMSETTGKRERFEIEEWSGRWIVVDTLGGGRTYHNAAALRDILNAADSSLDCLSEVRLLKGVDDYRAGYKAGMDSSREWLAELEYCLRLLEVTQDTDGQHVIYLTEEEAEIINKAKHKEQ